MVRHSVTHVMCVTLVTHGLYVTCHMSQPSLSSFIGHQMCHIGGLVANNLNKVQGGNSPLSKWRVHLLKGLVRTAISVHLQTFGE
jgi:hypothetical protein